MCRLYLFFALRIGFYACLGKYEGIKVTNTTHCLKDRDIRHIQTAIELDESQRDVSGIYKLLVICRDEM